MLLTLPYAALPCVIITVKNLQAPVIYSTCTGSHLPVFTVKSTGPFYTSCEMRGDDF